MVVRRLLATAVTVPLLLVAACNGDEPTPQMPTSPATSSSTSTPTPTVDPLAIPVEATKPTKAGAEALIRHFWDMVGHLVETGDSAPVRKLYGQACDFCSAGVAFYESTLKQKHVFEGGNERVARVQASLINAEGDAPAAYADVTTKSEPQTERDAKGAIVNEFPGGTTKRGYFLRYEGGHWIVTNVEAPE